MTMGRLCSFENILKDLSWVTLLLKPCSSIHRKAIIRTGEMTWKAANQKKKMEIHHQQRPSPLNQHFKLPLSLGKERRGMRLRFRKDQIQDMWIWHASGPERSAGECCWQSEDSASAILNIFLQSQCFQPCRRERGGKVGNGQCGINFI